MLLKIVDPDAELIDRMSSLVALESDFGDVNWAFLSLLRHAKAQLFYRRRVAIYYAMWLQDADLLERLVRSSTDFGHAAARFVKYAVEQAEPAMLGILLSVTSAQANRDALYHAAKLGRASCVRAALSAGQELDAVETACQLARDGRHREVVASISAYRARLAAAEVLSQNDQC